MKCIPNPALCLFIFSICVSLDSLSQNQAYRQNTNVTQANRNPALSQHFKVPDPVGFVNDFENLFTEAEIKTLDSTIIAIHNKTSVQIAIITIDSNMVNKTLLEDFVKETFKAWGLQVNGHFNGILIGLSNAYKKLSIENGTGVEQVLNDYEIQGIEKTFIPYLKEDKYYPGTISGLTAIMNKLQVK